MMDAWRLRRIGMAQWEDVARVIVDAFAAEPWRDDWRDRAQLRRYMADLLEGPQTLALGLYAGEELTAVALGRVIHWHAGTQYRIDDLGVCTARQGMGLGTRLLREIEAYAAAHGIRSIALKTDRRAGACPFYMKNGFVENPYSVQLEKLCGPEA